MKRQQISNIIGNINEGILAEAAVYEKPAAKKGKRAMWMKWAAAAACLALVVAVGIPKPESKTIVDNVILIEYEHAYYEIIENNPEALEKFGIVTTEITEDLAGEHISYLNPADPEAERSDFVVSDEKTDMELLTYKPAENKAHLIFRRGEEYYIARFCNYLNPDSVSYPVSKAFEVYGIYSGADIKSIVPASADNTWKASGAAVAGEDAAVFYDEMLTLKCFSEDEYYALDFTEDLEEHVLVVETADGIRFAIRYYPNSGFMYLAETQTYCQMSPALETWLQNG